MKVNDLFLTIYPAEIVADDTTVYIQEGDQIAARGKWFQDNILRYNDHEVLSFLVNNETHTLRVKVRGLN